MGYSSMIDQAIASEHTLLLLSDANVRKYPINCIAW